MIKKTYIAASLSEAIQLIKREMGSSAAIVSTLSRPAKKTLFRFTPARIEVVASVDERHLTQQQIETLLGKSAVLSSKGKINDDDLLAQEYRMLRDKVRKIEDENAALKRQIETLAETQDEVQFVRKNIRTVSIVRPVSKRRRLLSQHPEAHEVSEYLHDSGFDAKGLKRWQDSLKSLPMQAAHADILDASIAFFAQEFLAPQKSLGPVVSFMGAKNSGKTTLLQNVAASLRAEGKKVIILNFEKARSEMDHIRKSGKEYDAIFIDVDVTNINDRQTMRRLPTRLGELKTQNILVFSAAHSDLHEQLQAFRDLRIDGLAFTHLDKNPLVGAIYNVMAEVAKPIYYFGIGPKIPEDFESATAERLVSLLFKLDEEFHDEAVPPIIVNFGKKGVQT